MLKDTPQLLPKEAIKPRTLLFTLRATDADLHMKSSCILQDEAHDLLLISLSTLLCLVAASWSSAQPPAPHCRDGAASEQLSASFIPKSHRHRVIEWLGLETTFKIIESSR